MSKNPNILLIITDQQQALAAAPSAPFAMPHTRRLAEEGVRFTRAYTPCPLCLPARVSMTSGVYPHRHGLIDNANLPGGVLLGLNQDPQRSVFKRLPVEGLACFSQGLAAKGYRNFWSGRWHAVHGHHPLEVGFEGFDYTEQDFMAYRRSLGFNYDNYSPKRIASGRFVERPGYESFPLYGKTSDPVEAELDYLTVTRAIDRLRTEATGEAPWFLGVGFIAPHDPYVVPEPYASLYDPDRIELPASFRDDLRDKPGLYRKQREVAYANLDERAYREMVACYYGFNTFADDQIGRLLAALEATGQTDNTLVILTSDHGDNMAAHGLIYKSLSMFEETLRIPMVARWPMGIQNPGREADSLVSLLDIAPTCLQMAGLEIPADYHGFSLAPFFADPAHRDSERKLLIESEGVGNHVTQRVIVGQRWKYVYNGFDCDELYDLEKDPGERRNLSEDPAHADILRACVAELWAELVRTDDSTCCRLPQPHTMLIPFGPGDNLANPC